LQSDTAVSKEDNVPDPGQNESNVAVNPSEESGTATLKGEENRAEIDSANNKPPSNSADDDTDAVNTDTAEKAEDTGASAKKTTTENEIWDKDATNASAARDPSDEEAKSQATVRHENLSKDPRDDEKQSCGDKEVETEPVQAEPETNEDIEMLECYKNHDKSDDEEDQGAPFMTQEMNISSKVIGLLTQAGTFSDDDGDDSDAMDEDMIDNGDGVNLEYEGVKVNAESAPRPPTIDTSEQLPMSGLTAPSQHLSMSHKSERVGTSQLEEQSNHEPQSAESKEADQLMEVDGDQTQDAGQTEDTYDSLYGAATQLLPSAAAGEEQEQNEPASNPNKLPAEARQPEKQTVQETDVGTTDTPQKKSTEHASLKITPRKGVLSMVSYPNEHVENNDTNEVSDAHVKAKSTAEAQDDATIDDENDETQQSQDLLETSPISIHREKEHDGKTEQKADNAEIGSNEDVAVQKAMQKEQGCEDSEDDSTWLSNRHDERRLVLPVLRPSASMKDEVDQVNTAAKQNSLTAESDDDSILDNYNTHPTENDPIEDTQNEDVHHHTKHSCLKRLSRGTTPTNPPHKEDSTSKSVSLQFSTNAFNSTLGKKQYGKRSNSGSKSSITPKCLQYAKQKENSESEAEFEDVYESHEDTNERMRPFEQSQSEYRALKQLEEFEEFTRELPTADQLGDLRSRKELQDEIERINQSYGSEIKRLKKKISDLRKDIKEKSNAIKQRDDTIDDMRRAHKESIREKDNVIKKKASVIERQEAAIAKWMGRFKGVSPPGSVVKRSSGRRKADDDSEDESVVLSALKPSAAASTYGGKKKSSTPVSKQSASRTNDSVSKSNTRQRRAHKDDLSSRPLSPEIWRQLEEKGWKYKTGPEPYNMGE
jgi:hypothetical protein